MNSNEVKAGTVRQVVFAGRSSSRASTDGPNPETIEVRFIYSPDEPAGAIHSRRYENSSGEFSEELNSRHEAPLGCPCGTF